MLLASLLVLPALLTSGSGEHRALPTVLTVTKEWTSPELSAWDDVEFRDIDGDGARECIVWSQMDNSIRIFDPPTYALRLSANYSLLMSVGYGDLGSNGTIQLIIGAIRTGQGGPSLTVLDGKTLAPLWNGPEMPGLVGHRVGDVDGDGRPELVLLDRSVQVYDGTTFIRDWASPELANASSGLELCNLDSDPAPEILAFTQDFMSNLSRVVAFDGASRSPVWESEAMGNSSLATLIHAGDVDADGRPEFLVQTTEMEGTGPGRASYFVLSGQSGAVEWNFSVSGLATPEIADPDRDGSPDCFVVASDIGGMIESYNVSFLLFDLAGRRQAWALGPFLNTFGSPQMKQATSRLADVNGDGFPEIVVLNFTMNLVTGAMSSTFDVFGGPGLPQLWDSPALKAAMYDPTFLGIDPLEPVELDADGSPELVLSEVWSQPPTGLPHGIVHVYSASTFAEEWNTGDLKALAYGTGGTLVKDPAPDLFVLQGDGQSTWGSLLDPLNRQVVWEGQRLAFANPVNLTFADIVGGPWNEVLLIGNTDDGEGNLNSTVHLLNDTTLGQSWQSERIPGEARLLALGDLDNDSHAEAAISVTIWNQDGTGAQTLIVYDFFEGLPPMPDLALSAADLSLSENAPFAGTTLGLWVRLRNAGGADVAGCALALSVDGARVDSRRVSVTAHNSTSTLFNWTAVAGHHTLTLTADPDQLVEELDEANNVASINLTVAPRPPPVAAIASPSEGQSFSEPDLVWFSANGSGAPAGGSLTYHWSSELSGTLGTAAVFSARLPVGAHLVTLTVDDGFNRASATVNVTVAAAPPPPGITRAVISSPRNGASIRSGDQMLFDGTKSQAADPGFTLTYDWSSNQSGRLARLQRFSRSLPAGNHNITLTVDDGHGGRSSAHVMVRVRPPESVAALISSPLDGDVYDNGQKITFDGLASAGPAGSVLSFSWEDNATGEIGTEGRISLALPPGAHLVVLTVSDGLGHRASASVNLTVRPNRAPRLELLAPLDGAVVKGRVDVSGTAGDDIRVEKIFIRIDNGAPESIAGAENWSHSWDTRGLPDGRHRLTVWASDGELRSAEVTLTVTVRNAPPSGGSGLPGWMLILALGLALVLAGVVAALLLRRRRKGPDVLDVEAET